MNNIDSFKPFVRQLSEGMGVAVAERTILRKKEDGSWETWKDVAHRVALGNALLCPNQNDFDDEYNSLNHHISKATLLMSGRHLQHGDETQPYRSMECHTNCATSATSFLLFLLLLSGSGVGRCYDDDMMLVNWDNAPTLRCVLSHDHPDFDWGAHESVRDAKHKYGNGKDVLWHQVDDSREGWAKALEIFENAAFEKIHKDKMLILDFSKVREKGRAIKGMQNRPASGPVALMNAFSKATSLKGAGLDPWLQALYIDHYFAECVLVGGARRAARLASKSWKDPSIFDFITVKRPIEFLGKNVEEILSIRNEHCNNNKIPPMGFLWSSNNSIAVDNEFWSLVATKRNDILFDTTLAKHARKVFKFVMESSYADGTGEPGFINVDKLTRNDEGWDGFYLGDYVNSEKYQLNDETRLFMIKLAKRAKKKQYNVTTNPCVTADTTILTSLGPRYVSDLIDTPFIAIVDGKPYQSTGFWKTGTRPVLKIRTKRGYEIRLTHNHKVMVETSRQRTTDGKYNITKEWINAGDITPGDKIILNNHQDFKWDGKGTFDEGWLLGEMIGDGGYNKDATYYGYVRFWGEQKEFLANKAFDIVKTLPKINSPIPLSGPVYSKANDTLQVQCKALSLLAEGLIETKSKNILPTIYDMSSEFICGVIRGLFDADGTVLENEHSRSVRLAQSNLDRLHQIQSLLLHLGIASTVFPNRKDAQEQLLPDGNGGMKLYKTKACHELVISKSNMHLFMDIIGFYDQQKSDKAISVMNSITRCIYQERFTAEVSTIEDAGEEDVYDCSVPEVNAFDANGIMVHNCGEIILSILGGFCVIADCVPFHADTLAEAEDAFRVATRALIRVNLMDSIYKKEVIRTNRIGVGMTGVHEFAWKFFECGFRDLIEPDFETFFNIFDGKCSNHTLNHIVNYKNKYTTGVRSAAFWMTLSRFNRAVREESITYSKQIGVSVPHTSTTIKPAGTTSKVFGLTEGWHLPPLAYMLRWVQFRHDDPLVDEYKQSGYPWKSLTQYSGTVIIGFPTVPQISKLEMGDKLVLAGDASPEEQYKWIMLGERYWLAGVEETGNLVTESYSNNISYTLKYNPNVVDYKSFKEMILKYQPQVKCTSVMPQVNNVAYEYLPEEAITKSKYEEIAYNIQKVLAEDIGREHLDCANGGCPIDFFEGDK